MHMDEKRIMNILMTDLTEFWAKKAVFLHFVLVHQLFTSTPLLNRFK